jgi:hypothetical protein
METQLWVVSALVGWCGTPWPRPWPFPWPPPPDPDPNPWISKVIGVVGGLAGGWAVTTLAGGVTTDGFVVAAVGAWVGSKILSEVYGLATGGLRRG